MLTCIALGMHAAPCHVSPQMRGLAIEVWVESPTAELAALPEGPLWERLDVLGWVAQGDRAPVLPRVRALGGRSRAP